MKAPMNISLDKEHLESHISTRAVMENITEAAVIVDPSGYVVHHNGKFADRFGDKKMSGKLTENVETASGEWSFDKLLGKALSRNGFIPLRLFFRTQQEGNPVSPAYASMLQSRLTGEPMAVLIQLDEQLLRFAQRLNQINDTQREHSKLLRDARMESTTDPLTRLKNRRFIVSYLDLYWHNFKRMQSDCTVIFIDLDHFKRINDTYGHDVGDAVLEKFAEVMRHAARDGDALGRWGGEEFIAVLPQCNADQAGIFLSRLSAVLKEQIFNRNQDPFRVTFSAGAASFSQGRSVEDVIRLADNGVYQAKESGRDRYVIHQVLH